MAEQKNGMPLARRLLLYLAVGLTGTVIGFFSVTQKWQIGYFMNDVRLAILTRLAKGAPPWFVTLPPSSVDVATYEPDALAPGLVLVAGMDADRRAFVRVVDREGKDVYGWQPEGLGVLPGDPDDKAGVPQGIAVLEDGGLIVNFDNFLATRLSPCADPVWSRADSGRYAVAPGPAGTFYMPGENQIGRDEQTGYPNHLAPLADQRINRFDADGNLLQSKPVLDVLRDNDLLGLMYLQTLENFQVRVRGDTMHMADIEVFPQGLDSRLFAPGDLLISLRNISTVLVVDPETWAVKFYSIGPFLRQNDADFASGDRILVYDNRNLAPLVPPEDRYSRIVELDAETGAFREYFRGDGTARFYSGTLGRQQLLANGNMMVVSPREGRAIEVDANGRLVWEISNRISPEHNGVLTEANLLPLSMNREFFADLRKRCEG